MSDKLRESILQIQEIGIKIAELSELSKKLRSEVAQEIATCGLGTVNEDEPVQFLMDGKFVSVNKAKGAKDFNIIVREFKSI